MNNTDSNRKIGFYIRVSTERQAKVEEGSLKNQKQMLLAELNKRNLQNKNWGKLIEIYVDEGISGKDINRPAFQKMLKDIEIGKIDTIMFTELSRFSRSLKDFLNIFEFTQKYNCDLICLKTDIDTTSPYKNLITKILMVFGEFEREMTSQRTSINAYERSKRGLANGGFTPLGYKRDKNKKGYLHIDEKEAAIVREIFKTYIKEKSIQKTMEAIKSKYEGLNSRLKKITKSRIYSILTNKAYIGIREIYKKDKSKYEEVKAVWNGIIDEKLFRQAENLLKANKERLHWRNSGRFNYLLSGLIMCGKCGEKLQGKCAYSRINKKHYYYSHKNTCKNGGLSGIDAEVTHKLVFDWLDEISNNGEKFNQLKTEGKIRIKRRIDFLNKTLDKLKTEKKSLVNEIEARLNELTNTKSEIVKKTIEESIIKLDQAKKEIEDKHVYIKYEIERLEKLIQDDNDLFREYSDRIKTVFRPPTNKTKNKLKEVISYIKLDERNVKIALSPVNLNEPVRALFGFSPRAGLEPATR
ncbi:MAG: recombinase family protein [Elusimicrobia bacterium]|nr:recombinase family protein [Elusimicrobiota bacterium]